MNYEDLVILAFAYHTVEGDYRFDERVDFNSDGVIDYSDLILLAQYYELS